MAKQLSKLGSFSVATIAPNTLLGVFNETKFSMFCYEYPSLFPTNNVWGIHVADKRDIAAMKIAAVMDRGTKKDFIDLYFLSKEGITLNDSLSYYDNKYGSLANNLYSILKSFTYFVDAEESEMPKMLKLVSWDEVKTFFRHQSTHLADTLLK